MENQNIIKPTTISSKLKELTTIIAKFTTKDENMMTKIPELMLVRRESPTEPSNMLYLSSICFAAQGAKRVILGDEIYDYNENNYLITSVDMPVMGQIVEASKETPYYGLVLQLNMKEISQLLVDMDIPPATNAKEGKAMTISSVDEDLLDSLIRLIKLLETPESIPVLAPLIYKEILFRILQSEQGARLRYIAAVGGQNQQISKAVEWLKENYSKAFKVEQLSTHIGMSVSSFHHHFKTFTSMTPLQYQKLIRLHKARQLMLTEKLDASSASFEVGYESPSQFSREYSRMFGLSPLKDVKRIIETV